MNNIELGNKLKIARLNKGLTIKRLAEITGVSVTTIVNAEHGTTKPYGKVLKLMSDALDIPLSELI